MTKSIPKSTLEGLPVNVVLGTVGRANAELEKAAGFRNLKAQYMGILWLVSRLPGLPQGVYAAALHYDLATFGRHVEALVLDGLMNKIQADHDHRVMQLTVTQSGEAALETAESKFSEIEVGLNERLGSKTVAQITERLQNYLDVARDGD